MPFRSMVVYGNFACSLTLGTVLHIPSVAIDNLTNIFITQIATPPVVANFNPQGLTETVKIATL